MEWVGNGVDFHPLTGLARGVEIFDYFSPINRARYGNTPEARGI
jgi:hypothetical protein